MTNDRWQIPGASRPQSICHLSSVICHWSFRVWVGSGSLELPLCEREVSKIPLNDFAVAVRMNFLHVCNPSLRRVPDPFVIFQFDHSLSAHRPKMTNQWCSHPVLCNIKYLTLVRLVRYRLAHEFPRVGTAAAEPLSPQLPARATRRRRFIRVTTGGCRKARGMPGGGLDEA